MTAKQDSKKSAIIFSTCVGVAWGAGLATALALPNITTAERLMIIGGAAAVGFAMFWRGVLKR